MSAGGFVSDGIKNFFFCLSLYNVLLQQNKSIEIKVKGSHLKYFLMNRYSYNHFPLNCTLG